MPEDPPVTPDMKTDDVIHDEGRGRAPVSRKRKPPHRIFGSFFCGLFGVLFFTFIAFLCLWGFLLIRPIPLGFITGIIENFVSSEEMTVHLKKPRLTLGRKGNRALRLAFDSMTARFKNGDAIEVTKPRAAFVKKALLIGEIRPSFVTADGVHMRLTADEDFYSLFESKEDSAPVILSEMYEKHFKKGYFSGLRQLHIKKINIIAEEPQKKKPVFAFKSGVIALNANKQGFRGAALGSLTSRYANGATALKLKYDAENRRVFVGAVGRDLKLQDKLPFRYSGKGVIRAGARFDDLLALDYLFVRASASAGRLAPSDNAPPVTIRKAGAALEYKRAEEVLTLDANVRTVGNGAGSLSFTARDIESDVKNIVLKGDLRNVNYDEHFAGPVDFENIALRVALSGLHTNDPVTVSIKNFSVDANKKRLSGKADVRLGEKTAVKCGLKTPKLTIEELLALWPRKLPGTARLWAEESVLAGFAEAGEFNLDYNEARKNAIKTSGKIPLRDGTIKFLPEMPPLEKAQGALLFNDLKITVAVKEAFIGEDIRLSKAEFVIPDADADIPLGELSSYMEGGVKTLLTLLDKPPLEVIAKNGMKPETGAGVFAGNLKLSLPLVKEVKAEEIKFEVDLKTQAAGMNAVIGEDEYALTDGDLTMAVTPEGLTAEGSAHVNETPISGLKLTQSFLENPPVGTEVEVRTPLTAEGIKKIRFDLDDYLSGDLMLDMKVKLQKDRIIDLSIDADLTEADVMFPWAKWTAPTGEPKRLTLRGVKDGAKNLKIDTAILTGETVRATVENLILDQEYKPISAMLTDFTLKDFILSDGATLKRDQDGTYLINAAADYVSLLPVFEDDRVAEPDTGPFPKFIAEVRIKKLKAGKEKILKSLLLRLGRYQDDPKRILGNGRFRRSDYFDFTVFKKAAYEKGFRARARDAGKFLRAYGAYENLRRGKLEITGETIAGKTADEVSRIKGNVFIKDGKLIKAPTVARILSLASLTGIDNLFFIQEGVAVDDITFDFVKVGETVNLEKGGFHSSAVGLTFAGDYNLASKTVYLKGAVTPFYTLNSFLGEIPLIGKLLISKQGEGVISTSYVVRGDAYDPTVIVNPLSVATPGMLRQLFEAFY